MLTLKESKDYLNIVGNSMFILKDISKQDKQRNIQILLNTEAD
jgi:hypothetical protein